MGEPNNKVGKRKAHIVVKAGGGNIGGLVIWGGVVAVGSLIAAFAVMKRRQGSACDKKECNHKGGSKQGLRFIRQTPSSTSHLSPCSGSTNVVESPVDPYGKDLILEQNPTPMIKGVTQDHSDDDRHRFDDLAKESIPSSVECGGPYEFSFPVLDASLLDKVGNEIKQSSGEDYVERPAVTKVEKIVNDLKIIARGMSKVHAVDAPNDLMAGNETVKLEETEKVVDAEIAISSIHSDDSKEEKVEVEKDAAVETIANKIPTNKTNSADDTAGENLAPVGNIEVMKDREMVDRGSATAKNSSPLNSVDEGNDSGDVSPSKENIQVRKDRDVANNERVITETASSMHSEDVADNQEEVDVKADPGEDLHLMKTNDASKHKVSLACSVEEDENDGYVDNEEDNEHEIYTADKDEDGSEGTETSSAESNSAKIWSVESLDASFLEPESGATHLTDSVEKIMEDEGKPVANSLSFDRSKNGIVKAAKDDLQNWTLQKEVPGLAVENRGVPLTKWRSWALSIPALLLLLLLLFAHHNALFFLFPSSSEN